MSQNAGDRQGRRAWVVGVKNALASNRAWLPVVAIALVLSLVRPPGRAHSFWCRSRRGFSWWRLSRLSPSPSTP